MLINFTNHPYSTWGEPVRKAAEQYGEVVDFLFPAIDPMMPTEELRPIVDSCTERIEGMHPDAVVAAGEFTFLFMLVDRLLQDGVKVLCACSGRETRESMRPDGSSEKTAVFHFERFRPYAYYDAGKGNT